MRLRTFKVPLKLTVSYWRDMFARPVRRQIYRVKRSDGMYWAGPYKYQGVTFTNVEGLIYEFNSKESAEAAVRGCDLQMRTRLHKITIEQVE